MQMMEVTTAFVVSNYLGLEEQLLNCLDYIPRIPNNSAAISPKLVPIILESCSLIESIFKGYGEESKKYNFKDYSRLVEPYLELEEAASIILTHPIEFMNPFDGWRKTVPNWWQSYNKLKHDRLKNYQEAKLEVATQSMCALHQVIARTKDFFPELVTSGWFPNSEDLYELIHARTAGVGGIGRVIPAETKLFVSPNHEHFPFEADGKSLMIAECEFSERVLNIITIHEWF